MRTIKTYLAETVELEKIMTNKWGTKNRPPAH